MKTKVVENVKTIVVGAGPVGLAFALMRAQSGETVTILDKAEDGAHLNDIRRLALSYGSLQTLSLLGLGVSKIPHASIQHVHVSEQGSWGHTQLHSADGDSPSFGAVVSYADLVTQLNQLVKRCLNISFIRPVLIDQITENEECVQLNLMYEELKMALSSSLLVHAEGGVFNSKETVGKDYQQIALTADVTFKVAKPFWAWERFTQEGPIALLPNNHEGYSFNLVWCISPDRAYIIKDYSDSEFLKLLNETIAHLTGQIVAVTPRVSFQLGLKKSEELYSKMRVNIGNAAQILHPVAGQGLNLGLRDAFVLNQSIQNQASIAQAVGDFRCRRQFDRSITIGITDMLAVGFFNKFGSYMHSLGFGLINALPALKRQLAKQFMFGSFR